MTGSSTIGLMDAAADTLAGRIEIISLPTTCWGENKGDPTHSIFSDTTGLPHLRQAGRDLDDAVNFGQFPEILSAKTAEEKRTC